MRSLQQVVDWLLRRLGDERTEPFLAVLGLEAAADDEEPHPKIRRTRDGALLLNFGDDSEGVDVAAISGDGQRVLTVREVGVAEIWDAASGAAIATIRPESPLQGRAGTAPVSGGFKVFIESAALNHDGSIALLGLNDGSAGIFQVSDAQRLVTLRRPSEPSADRWSVIRAVAFSADEQLALVGFDHRSAGVWTTGGELVAFLETPDGGRIVGRPFVRDTLISSIAMSPDNRFLFAGSSDMTVSIWDVSSKAIVFGALEHAEHTTSVFDRPEGFGWVTTTGSVWRSRGEQPPTKSHTEGGAPEAFNFSIRSLAKMSASSADGRAVAITSRWRDAVELRLDGELMHQFDPSGHVGDFAVSPDRQLVAIGEIGKGGGSFTRRVYVHDTTTGRCRSSHGEHDWQISQVEFSPDASCVISLGDDIVVWDVKRERVLQRIVADRVTTRFCFLPDGRLLVVDRARARIYRAQKLLLEWVVPTDYGTEWCVGHDGKSLTIAMNQGVVRFDLESGALLGKWEAPMPRPAWLPAAFLAQRLGPQAGAALWQTDYGTYLHQSDGPRGWIQPLRLSQERLVVVPTGRGAAVIRVDLEQSLVGRVAFEGRLRASRIVGDEVLLVNDHGRLFRQTHTGA